MIYPEFLKKKDVIGITAPSAGVGRKLDSFQASVDVLKEQGYSIKETDDVRVNDQRAASAEVRAEELKSLYQDDEVKMIMCAAGGDFNNEVLPYVDWKIMRRHPKYLMGASDPTALLYPLTTKYDVATLYGMNAGAYDPGLSFQFIQDNLNILKGKKVIQHSSDLCQRKPGWEMDHLELTDIDEWKCTRDKLNITGRAVGGCLDVMKDLFGTPYDGTAQFVKKYAEDGFVWFFDVYGMSAENVYRTLCQMRYAGYLEHAKAVVMGRVLFESSDTGMNYEEALTRALPDIPAVYEADIGHTDPCMTLILGAMVQLKYLAGRGSLKFMVE